jgi:hypothetical protein
MGSEVNVEARRDRIEDLVPVILATVLISGFWALAFPSDKSGSDMRILIIRTHPELCEFTAAAPVLELPAGGGYRLNYRPQTREEIETWFANSFSGRSKLETWLREKYYRRPPGQRPLVIFRPDSTRLGEKRWIVRMVNAAGGEVVSPRTRCPVERQHPGTGA